MTNTFKLDCPDIILREFTVDDLDSFHALTWQPEIYEFLPGWNVSRELREDWLINYEIKENKEFLKAIDNGGDIGELRLRLGIVSKRTGDFIGWCCTGIKDELPTPNREIVYAISKNYRGKGYTTQAAQGLIKYLFENTDVEVLNALALLRNIPSNRVLQKCNFKFQDIIEIENEKYNYYTLTKSECHY